MKLNNMKSNNETYTPDGSEVVYHLEILIFQYSPKYESFPQSVWRHILHQMFLI